MYLKTPDGGTHLDKTTFIRRAPMYYGLAIALYFRNTGEGYATENTIDTYYFVPNTQIDDPDFGKFRLSNATLLRQAVKYLIEKEIIQVHLDDFGPSIMQTNSDFDTCWKKLESDPQTPFSRYRQLGDKVATDWLYQALESVNEHYSRLAITESDFEFPNKDWEPIPLDRGDAQLTRALIALDDTIEGLRIDNGYAASVPEERDFVANELAEASTKLKNTTSTSSGFIKAKIMDPLSRLIGRFGKASLGLLAEAARQSFIEWLKTKGIYFLDGL
jgi:hypothetical protein